MTDRPLYEIDLRQNHEARARWDALKQERDALKVSWDEKVVEAGGLRVLLEIAKDERDTALRELAAIEAVRGTHDCGCEVCGTISSVCPATASSYALEIIALRARDLEYQREYRRHAARAAKLERVLDAARDEHNDELAGDLGPGMCAVCDAIAAIDAAHAEIPK